MLKLRIVPNKDKLTEGKESVSITGFSNFEIMEKYGLCDLHEEKKEKFVQMMHSYKTKCFRKNTAPSLVWSLLKEKPKTVKELADSLGRKENAVRRYLRVLEKDQKVKKEPNIREFSTGRIKEVWSIKSST